MCFISAAVWFENFVLIICCNSFPSSMTVNFKAVLVYILICYFFINFKPGFLQAYNVTVQKYGIRNYKKLPY